jgi:hypothetical protein
MRALFLLILLFSLLGCARKVPPAPAVAAMPLGAATVPHSDAPVISEAGEPATTGRTPAQWAEALHSSDASLRAQATLALRDLNDRGLPHLLDGLRSRSADTRLACLHALTKPALLGQQRTTLPMLQEMLADRDPAVRHAAAVRIGWFGVNAQGALPALQRLAANDSADTVRAAAVESAKVITILVSGKVPDYFGSEKK